MPKIQYPPGNTTTGKGESFDTCVAFCNDPVFIEFVNPGAIEPLTPGIFTPDLPMGQFGAGDVIGPYYPVADNTEVTVDFLDKTTNILYKNHITIQSSCP
jgi:hypothetical protein